jgi:hypothetical protein
MTFRYEGNSRFAEAIDFDSRLIYANGVVDAGSSSRFTAFLNKNAISPGATVILDSPGGVVSEALEMGRTIRAAGLNTEVVGGLGGGHSKGGVCFSACTLIFVGGLERYIADGANFGVHQISTGAKLTPSEALGLGQYSIGAIAEYVSFMGVAPEFVARLTRTGPDKIDLISTQELAILKVTTPAFTTDWRIKSVDGGFYLLGATTTRGGLDKMILFCQAGKPILTFMFNTSGHFMRDTLANTTDYGFEFDSEHLDILPEEIVERVTQSGDNYVIAEIALSPRILERLRTTRSLTFEMMMPSHISYSGWTTDFAGGRDQFFNFLRTCH